MRRIQLVSHFLTVAAALGALPAWAQAGLEPPPAFQTSDRFGVDVVSGSLNVSSPTISVGDPAHGGLSFTATWDSNVGAWRHSTWGEVTRELAKPDPNCFAFYTVVYMGGSNIFQRESCGSLNFDLIDGHGKLVETSSNYIYTALDGSIATYSKGSVHSPIQTISRPGGEVITYTSTSISNNYGYQIHFSEGSGGLTVTALNNAVDACGLSATTCTFSRIWPSLTFTSVGNERRVTDNLGRTTRITLDATDPALRRVASVSRPTTTSGASVTYTYGFVRGYGTRVLSANDGSGLWTYAYETYCPPTPFECGPMREAYDVDTTVTDPNGGVTVYNIYYSGRSYWTGDLDQQLMLLPSLNSITDPLNRTTIVSQNAMGLHSATYPEGNGISISRNEVGAVTQIHTTPKPGSGLSDTYVTAVYPSCSSEPIRCHFPSSVTDAMGNTTDFTYDAAGNLLTETGPAPTPGAPRPQTRYVWEQRYAWYKRNGSSTISRAATPVWVMVEQSQCMTGATC